MNQPTLALALDDHARAGRCLEKAQATRDPLEKRAAMLHAARYMAATVERLVGADYPFACLFMGRMEVLLRESKAAARERMAAQLAGSVAALPAAGPNVDREA